MQVYPLHSNYLRAEIIPFGARLMSLKILDKENTWINVTGGYDTVEAYTNKNNYYGAICGRYANRIAFGKFILNHQTFQLDINHGQHHLHGGAVAIHNQYWSVVDHAKDRISFKITLQDGEMGYPGEMEISLQYSFQNEHTLRMDYNAITSKDTIINLAPHSYFNLAGHGNILNHELKIMSTCFTPIDETSIPTGEVRLVQGSVFDFLEYKKIGCDIDQADDQLMIAKGYDHNYILQTRQPESDPIALLYEPISRRRLSLFSSQPGLQLYTCNWDEGRTEEGYGGQIYQRHSFVCLEPQHFPDSPNHINFPSVVLRAGEKYQHFTKYKFETI